MGFKVLWQNQFAAKHTAGVIPHRKKSLRQDDKLEPELRMDISSIPSGQQNVNGLSQLAMAACTQQPSLT